MLPVRRALAVILAASLSIGLAACHNSGKPEAGKKGDAIAKIAPPAGKAWTDVATATKDDGVVLGNPDAPIKLMEYASLTCPHCADFSEKASAKLRDKYVASGVVSWEMRNQIHDPFDLTMAMLVRCGDPTTFHALSEQLWANQADIIKNVQANGPKIDAAVKAASEANRYKVFADMSGLTDFFAARGISKEQSTACLTRKGFAEKLAKESEQQSKDLNVQGTPTFFLNGQQLDDKTWEALEPILQNAGAR